MDEELEELIIENFTPGELIDCLDVTIEDILWVFREEILAVEEDLTELLKLKLKNGET